MILYSSNTMYEHNLKLAQFLIIDSFTKWILSADKFLTVYCPIFFSEHIELLNKKYKEAIIGGTICPGNIDFRNTPFNNPLSEDFPKELITLSKKSDPYSEQLFNLLKSVGYSFEAVHHKGLYMVYTPTMEKIRILDGEYYRLMSNYVVVADKWVYMYEYIDSSFYPDISVLLKLPSDYEAIWKTKGVCRHCGSSFKGIFKKVCSNPKCNIPKDY